MSKRRGPRGADRHVRSERRCKQGKAPFTTWERAEGRRIALNGSEAGHTYFHKECGAYHFSQMDEVEYSKRKSRA